MEKRRVRSVRSLALSIGLSWAACAAWGGENLAFNGRFENIDGQGRAKGWHCGRAWSFAACGSDGSFGAVFENADTNYYGGVQQEVKAQPGNSYVFGACARTKNLRGKAHVCMEWYGANGKYVGGSYSRGVDGTQDWTEIRCQTPVLPTNAVRVTLQVFCDRESVGRAVFDDVWLRVRELDLVDGVYSSRYRNAAADGEVTFKAALNLPPGAERTAKGEFVFTDPENPRAPRKAAATIADGAASVTCAVSDFAFGENTVAFTLSGVPGRPPATRRIAFARLTPERERALKVRIDEFRRTIVDGKPFFPLGMYWSAVTERDLDVYKDSPFNCLMPYHAPNRAQMDMCAARGLKVIYNVVGRDLSDGSAIRRFREHPALLAWYLNDERPIAERAQLTAARDFAAAHDPDHPGWIAIYQHGEVRDYLPTSDVIGTDPYPLYLLPIGMVSEWTRDTRKGLMGLKPMWQIPQVFDKGAYPSNRKIPGICRPPTFDDMRNMAWQCLAGGANGLIFYSFFDLREMDKTTPFEKRWGEVKRMAEEIKGYEPFFLSTEPSPAVSADNDAVACCGWRLNGRLLTVVVNTLREPVKVKVTAEGIARDLELAPIEVRIAEAGK